MLRRIVVLLTVAISALALWAAVGVAGATKWARMPGFGTHVEVKLIETPNRTSSLVLMATDDGDLYRSTNRGSSWNGVHNTADLDGYTGAAFSPDLSTDGKVLVTTGDDLLQSTNSGASFAKIASPVDTSAALVNRAVAYSPAYSSDHTIFIGTNKGLYYSTDDGANWELIKCKDDYGSDYFAVNSISVGADYSGTSSKDSQKYIFLATNLGLYRIQNKSNPVGKWLFVEDIDEVTKMSPDCMYGLSHQMIAETDLGLLLVTNAAVTPNYTNISDGYFPNDKNGVPQFDETDIDGLSSAYRGPHSASGWDLLVGVNGDVYELTHVGTSRRSAQRVSSGLSGETINVLADWDTDDSSQLRMAGTWSGLFWQTNDKTKPTAWIGKTPLVLTDKTGTRKLKITWGGSDSLSGIDYFVAQYRKGGSKTWKTWKKTSGKHATFSVKQGTTYYFRVKSVDRAGNDGKWVERKNPTVVPYDDSTRKIRKTGKWSVKKKKKGRFMKTEKVTKKRKAKLTFRFYGKKVWVIYRQGKKMSKAEIYIDGKRLKKRLDTRGKKKKNRKRKLVKRWKKQKTHTIEIVNMATKKRPTLAIDGIGVLRE